MTMTECCRCTVLFLALLYFCDEAGLHVKGDEIGTHASFEDATIDERNLKLLLYSRSEQSQEHGIDRLTSWNKFAQKRRAMTTFHTLGEVVLHDSETVIPGTNTSNPTQVSFSSSNGRSWCIAKMSAKPDPVQEALDWTCGPIGGADCEPIQLGNACFLPNTVYSHASYAFNSYYQIHQHASGTCEFLGAATIVYEDPSYPGCSYPYRSGQPGAPAFDDESKSHLTTAPTLKGVSILLPMHPIQVLTVVSTLLPMWIM